jgi:hypothetical protein
METEHGEDPKFITANLQVAISPIDLASEGNLEFLTFWDGSSTPQHTHVVQISRLSEQEALKMGLTQVTS